MKPTYVSEGRNGYGAVDMYRGDKCESNVIAVVNRPFAEQLARALNDAVFATLPLNPEEVEAVVEGIDDLLAHYGADEESKTDDQVQRIHRIVDAMSTLRKALT